MKQILYGFFIPFLCFCAGVAADQKISTALPAVAPHRCARSSSPGQTSLPARNLNTVAQHGYARSDVAPHRSARSEVAPDGSPRPDSAFQFQLSSFTCSSPDTIAISCVRLIDPQCDMLAPWSGPYDTLRADGQILTVLYLAEELVTNYGTFWAQCRARLRFAGQRAGITYWTKP